MSIKLKKKKKTARYNMYNLFQSLILITVLMKSSRSSKDKHISFCNNKKEKRKQLLSPSLREMFLFLANIV